MRNIAKSVFPRPPYLTVAGVVALKVVNDKKVTRSKTPEVADPRTAGIEVVDLINTPVIRGWGQGTCKKALANPLTSTSSINDS